MKNHDITTRKHAICEGTFRGNQSYEDFATILLQLNTSSQIHHKFAREQFPSHIARIIWYKNKSSQFRRKLTMHLRQNSVDATVRHICGNDKTTQMFPSQIHHNIATDLR